MSDDQQFNPGLPLPPEPPPQLHQPSIVLGQPVSDPHDGLVLGEPVLDDAQPPIANGQPAVPPHDLPAANQDPHVQGDGPAINGHPHPEPLIAQPLAAPTILPQQAGSDDPNIAPRSLEPPPAGEAIQESAVEPVNYSDQETQESALKEEEETEQKLSFDSSDGSAPNRGGFGVGKPFIVAGMVIAVLGVVVAGIRKA